MLVTRMRVAIYCIELLLYMLPSETHTHTHKLIDIRIYWTELYLNVCVCVCVCTCLYVFYVVYGGWPWTLHYIRLSWVRVEPENPMYISLQFSFSFVLCVRAFVCRFPKCVHHPTRKHARVERETWENEIDEAFPYFPLCSCVLFGYIYIFLFTGCRLNVCPVKKMSPPNQCSIN